MLLSRMIGIINLVFYSFLKSLPLYIYCAHSCRWRHFFADITFSSHLAMLIRVVSNDRTVNTAWHRKVWLKPVRLYNATIVIRFSGLSSFQNYPNNLGVIRVCLAIVVCVPVCLHFIAPSHVKSAKYIDCRTTGYVTEYWSVSGTFFLTRARWRCSVTYISAT